MKARGFSIAMGKEPMKTMARPSMTMTMTMTTKEMTRETTSNNNNNTSLSGAGAGVDIDTSAGSALHSPSPSFPEPPKLVATSAACIAAAFITYPAEMFRLSFTNHALAAWDFERESMNNTNMNMNMNIGKNDNKEGLGGNGNGKGKGNNKDLYNTSNSTSRATESLSRSTRRSFLTKFLESISISISIGNKNKNNTNTNTRTNNSWMSMSHYYDIYYKPQHVESKMQAQQKQRQFWFQPWSQPWSQARPPIQQGQGRGQVLSRGPFEYIFSKRGRLKQKLRIVFSPLVRLVSHEMVSTVTTSTATTVTTSTATNSNGSDHHNHNNQYDPQYNTSTTSFTEQIKIGIIAGLCQALILCPLELHRANQLKIVEENHQRISNNVRSRSRHWMKWIKSQVHLIRGGMVGDPVERRKRAGYAVGILAGREILFNMTFFPLFHGLNHQMKLLLDGHGRGRGRGQIHNNHGHGHGSKSEGDNEEKGRNSGASASYPSSNQSTKVFKSNKSTPRIVLTSGILSGTLSGLICSLLVVPLDVTKTYMLYSREQWNVWSGKSVVGPPMKLLYRGLTVQAFVVGPTFGVVAAIYEFMS